MNFWNSIKKIIFGYDIFISYSRKDSLDYAYAIAQYFMRKGFECYIDQLSSITPGNELPSNIKDAVKRSTAFVLIGSEEAQRSEAIEHEILLFLENNRNKPLIPITIDGAINTNARWYSKIAGLALIDDSPEYLKKGMPAQDVLDRIENALQFTRKSDRLRNISLAVVFGILIITGSAAFYIIQAGNEVDVIEGERLVVLSQKDSVEKERDGVVSQIKIALDSVNKLTSRSDSLNKQISLKNAELEKVTDRFTKQYKSAQEMYDEFNHAIETISHLKSYFFSSGQLNVGKSEAIIFFKLDKLSIEPGGARMLDQFVEDWQNSENKPTIIVSGHFQAYRLDEESLDIIKLNDGGKQVYNIYGSDQIASLVMRYLTNKGIPSDKVETEYFGENEPLSELGILFNTRAEIYTLR